MADSTADASRVLIGFLGDIQYADRDDQNNRHYRNSLEVVRRAVTAFNESGVNAVVTLGDMLDGYCIHGGKPPPEAVRTSEPCLRRVLSVLEGLSAPIERYDLVGNHDLYNFLPDQLVGAGLKVGDGRTYQVRQHGNWDLVCINTFEHFLCFEHVGTVAFEESFAMLRRYHPDLDSAVEPGKPWLVRHQGRFPTHLTSLNGAMSDVQRDWLREVLSATKDAGRNAIVCSHAPLFGRPSGQPLDFVGQCKPWDVADILNVLHDFKDTVRAVISGHFHKGTYAQDEAGIHHVTVNAAVEATPGEDCWATLELGQDSARLHCHGRAVYRTRDAVIELGRRAPHAAGEPPTTEPLN